MSDISLVNEPFDLLDYGLDGILFGNMSSVAVLSAIIRHELDSCFHTPKIGCHINQVFVLLQTLSFKISFIDVEIQYDLEECLQGCSGTVNAFECVETQWRNAICIERFKFLGDLIQI